MSTSDDLETFFLVSIHKEDENQRVFTSRHTVEIWEYISGPAEHHKLFVATACLSAKSTSRCLEQTENEERKLFASMH